jgi:Tfp pilus assembly protein PilO
MKSWFEQHRQSIPLFVMIGLFSAMGLMAWFGIRPFHTYIKDKADAIQEYYAFRENRERQIKKLPDLEKQYEHIVAKEETIHILTSEDEIVDFVKTLEQLGEETGVHIEIQSKDSKGIVEKQKPTKVARKEGEADAPEEATAKKKQQPKIIDSLPYDRYLPISVVVIGEYESIVTFLHKMETLPYGLDVIGMKVQKRDIEEVAPKPSGPGSNPFLIFGQGETVAPVTDKAEFIPGSLEATFDTAVYISK